MALSRSIFPAIFFAFTFGCAFIFDVASAAEAKETLDHPILQSLASDENSEEAIKTRDRYYYCDCYRGYCYSVCRKPDLSTGAVIGIVLSSLLFFVAIAILFCYICACCCFKGRRQRRTGEVYTAQVVHSNQPQPPPGYFYGAQPAPPGVSIAHNHQAGAGAGAYPSAPSQPGVYYNNGFQVTKADTTRY